MLIDMMFSSNRDACIWQILARSGFWWSATNKDYKPDCLYGLGSWQLDCKLDCLYYMWSFVQLQARLFISWPKIP